MNSLKAETLIKWYLRLNGYFAVDNFIVHAGDDLSRISGGIVGNYTETDILAIRHKHSKEISGSLYIANDSELIEGQVANLDFVIAEVKTGNEDRPNKVWRNKDLSTIAYILRFAGFIEKEEQIDAVAKIVAEKGQYTNSSNEYSIRFIIFSEAGLNNHWKHVKNIGIDNVIDFFIKIRGECWIEAGIGIASIHHQWDGLINDIFRVANNPNLDHTQRKKEIHTLLE
jgi:hypothetical protein